VSAWLKRFGLHLAAAVGATGIFVAAAAVGANQTRQQVAAPPPATVVQPAPRPTARAGAAAAPTRVAPERSLAGTVQAVTPDVVDVLGVGGRLWRVTPAPGALIRLNGRAARLDALQPGDTVLLLGQAQARQNFVAHAITARRK
jgi:hypothetical protein